MAIKKWMVEAAITEAVHKAMKDTVTAERNASGLGRFEPTVEGAGKFVKMAMDRLLDNGMDWHEKDSRLIIRRSISESA